MKHVIRWFFTGVFMVLLFPSCIWVLFTDLIYWKDINMSYKDLFDDYNEGIND